MAVCRAASSKQGAHATANASGRRHACNALLLRRIACVYTLPRLHRRDPELAPAGEQVDMQAQDREGRGGGGGPFSCSEARSGETARSEPTFNCSCLEDSEKSWDQSGANMSLELLYDELSYKEELL